MTSDSPPAGPRVLALGDSLTAGYGLAPRDSFVRRLEAALAARHGSAVVHQAGVSGDTSADGLRRLPRVLAGLGAKPDLAIVEFGANDLLQGVPSCTRRGCRATRAPTGCAGCRACSPDWG